MKPSFFGPPFLSLLPVMQKELETRDGTLGSDWPVSSSGMMLKITSVAIDKVWNKLIKLKSSWRVPKKNFDQRCDYWTRCLYDIFQPIWRTVKITSGRAWLLGQGSHYKLGFKDLWKCSMTTTCSKCNVRKLHIKICYTYSDQVWLLQINRDLSFFGNTFVQVLYRRRERNIYCFVTFRFSGLVGSSQQPMSCYLFVRIIGPSGRTSSK